MRIELKGGCMKRFLFGLCFSLMFLSFCEGKIIRQYRYHRDVDVYELIVQSVFKDDIGGLSAITLNRYLSPTDKSNFEYILHANNFSLKDQIRRVDIFAFQYKATVFSRLNDWPIEHSIGKSQTVYW